MWKYLAIGCAAASGLLAQTGPSQVEYANLREDVRGLTQRTGELLLRVEQLERENAELKQRLGGADRNFVTLTQLNHALEDANRSMRAVVRETNNETLQRVAAQIEKLGKDTNAALDSLAKAQAPRSVVPIFTEDYAKEGTSYTVQKGDTVASIAKKTGGRFHDIINANKLSDPSRIVPGQTLFIPNPPTSAAK